MNGLDFDLRVLRPWARDPAFYQSIWTEQSDTPAHEGPTHHAVVELWTYTFPLSAADEARLAGRARHDSAAPRAGAREPHRQCARSLDHRHRDDGGSRWRTSTTLRKRGRRRQAGAERGRFRRRAPRRRSSSPGSSGRRRRRPDRRASAKSRLHVEPAATSISCRMTWDDEVALLKRELARAHASLKLEEQRNRGLPPLTPAANAEEYRAARQRGGHEVHRVPQEQGRADRPGLPGSGACARTSAGSCRSSAATSSASRATTSR